MKKWLRLSLFLLFMGLIPISCERCDSNTCECDDFSNTQDFKILDFALHSLELKDRVPAKENNYYPADSLILWLEVTRRQDVPRKTAQRYTGFGTQALACSPIPPQPINPIKSIALIAMEAIIADSTGRDSIAAGDTLNAYFEMNRYGFGNNFIPLEQENFRWYGGKPIALRWAQALGDSLQVKVEMQVQLSDGLIFRYPNRLMRLLPR